MQLSPDLVDYVLIHELCHLKEPGHGPAFLREMTIAIPDYVQRRTWFEREEPFLWRGSTR
jgi:predicted metal-dependent hydrolase